MKSDPTIRIAAAYIARLDLHDPQFNMREIVKQVLLLEEHLSHPGKLCADCVRKHLMTIEALAEEITVLISPDEKPEWIKMFQKAGALWAGQARLWLDQFNSGRSPQEIGAEMRVMRKKAIQVTPGTSKSPGRMAADHD